MEFKCTFFTDKLEGYTCKVTKAAIDKPNVEIISFQGKHNRDKTNNDVKYLSFSASKFQHFPRNLQRIFPRLKYLQVHHCDLKEISCQDLVGLEKLVRLDLDNNQLTSLPDDLFSNMQRLEYVCLDRNNIEFASSKLIEPIVGNSLEWFYIRKNPGIDEFFDSTNKSPGCTTIQALMAKIDEKCTPPPPPTSPATPTPSMPPTTSMTSTTDAAGVEIFKGFNEHRRLGRFTDFVITVGSKEFPVHKSFLALQSSALASIFQGNAGMRIAELSAEAVAAFLDYLYERKQPARKYACGVFKLATKYEVANLKAICEEIIKANINESNAFTIYKLACGPNLSEVLKVAAFRKLKESLGQELQDNLINNPEKLQQIVDTKKTLLALMSNAED